MSTTASQAWAILKRHARDEINNLRLQDLCNDNDRVSSLVAVHNSSSSNGGMILADLSRQRMTLETLNHLLRLSVSRGLRKYITRLAWGQNNPDVPLQIMTAMKPVKHHSRHDPRYQHYETSSTVQQKKKKEEKENNSNLNKESNNNNSHHQNAAAQQQQPQSANAPANFPDVMPSMHLALRAPKDQGLHMLTVDGVNALTGIHREWDRLARLSDSIRRGAWRGITGSMIRDVVVVGRGVSIQALKFVYQALCHDEAAIIARKFGLDGDSTTASRLLRRGLGGGGVGSTLGGSHNICPRRIHFLTSVDPLAAASLVSELEAGSTLVVSLALQGNEATGLATKTMKMWLLQQLSGGGGGGSSAQPTSRRADVILSKHMLLVTGNDQIAHSINKPESVFVIPEHSRCEPFISFSSATLLPLSIVFGWSICEQFLAGGHDMDCHFVETNPRHNLPVLLALTDVWNDVFLEQSCSGRIVTPYTQAMTLFPAFVAALEAQTCSSNSSHPSSSPSNNNNNNEQNFNHNHISCSSLVLDGGTDSAYDRSLYQSSKIINSEIVMVMNSQLKANTIRNLGAQSDHMEDVFQHADALMCSLFGHVDEMAFGGGGDGVNNDRDPGPLDQNLSLTSDNCVTQSASEGNRPSTLLMVSTLDAFACGQLIALSEHRAVAKARIWDIDPFTLENGCSLKTARTDQLREDLQKIYQSVGVDDEEDQESGNTGGMNLSTKTILGHYANLTKDQRVQAR